MKTLVTLFLLLCTIKLSAQDSLNISPSSVDTIKVYANPHWATHNDTVQLINNLIDRNNCEIQYTEMYCGNPLMGMSYQARMEYHYKRGYIITLNTQQKNAYFIKDSIAHITWKDPDIDTENYYFLVENILGEVYDAFSVSGHEVYLNLSGMETFWKITIVSKNCRKSQDIHIIKGIN